MPVYKAATRRVYFQSLTTAGADNTATTPTIKVVKDGGAQAAATNAPSHLGTGQWMVVLTATEMTADEVSVNHSAAGCASGVVTIYPESDYTTTVAGRIDAAITSRMATFAVPANFSSLSITAAGLVDITQAAADKVWGTAVRSLTDKSNFGINSIAAGTIGTAQFAVGAIDNTVIAANANTAIANAVLAAVVEGTLTIKQALQLVAAASAGKLSGAATATVTIRNKSDTVDAIVATVDADGNRSAITYTFT